MTYLLKPFILIIIKKEYNNKTHVIIVKLIHEKYKIVYIVNKNLFTCKYNIMINYSWFISTKNNICIRIS